MPRLVAGDHRGDEDPHGQVAGGHEEQGQLDVPGPREVVGEPLAEVDAVETGRFDVVVGVGAAQKSLEQEQAGDHEKIPGRGPLGRGQPDFFRRAEPQVAARLFLVGAVPAQQVVLPTKNNTKPVPPSRPIRLSTLQKNASAVGSLPTIGSGGQLLVYE